MSSIKLAVPGETLTAPSTGDRGEWESGTRSQTEIENRDTVRQNASIHSTGILGIMSLTKFWRFFSTLCLLLIGSAASGADLAAITKADATNALRSALTQGALKAVGLLGTTDGFLLNPEVKISLPPQLQSAEQVMRRYGLGRMADELTTTMNRAAEAAVPEAKTLLVDAVKSMSVTDAKAILTGSSDSATQYFRGKTQATLATRFKPIVAQATSRLGVAQSYNALASRAARFGLLDAQAANLDDYVTGQALDGLYKMIAKEELAIRNDPVGQTSKLLQRVFGAASPSR